LQGNGWIGLGVNKSLEIVKEFKDEILSNMAIGREVMGVRWKINHIMFDCFCKGMEILG